MKEKEKLEKALRWCRRQWTKRWPEETGHCSFLVEKILTEAEEKFGIDTFGVEGFNAQEWGNYVEGVSYLNTGDTYDITICFQSFGKYSGRFFLSSWGDTYERFERRMDRQEGKRNGSG